MRATISLAGRTSAPAPQAGAVRTGGFGGAGGLADYLFAGGFGALVDATHPFAAGISRNAAEAARRAGLPLLRLSRPAWRPVEGDRWAEVGGMEAAPAALGPAPRRVFLAIGRQEIGVFRAAPRHSYLVRSIEPPAPDALPGAEILLARGPFNEADERRLLEERAIEVIVAKNSGGEATYAKIAAARALGLPVVMVLRPDGRAGVATVEEIIARLDHLAAEAKRGV